jgi:hypothetical protein
MKHNQWPTREEWAESQRAFYYDRFEDLDFDRQLSAHATTQEVDVAIRALRTLWKAKGVHLRELCVPKELHQQRGESGHSYYARQKLMTSEEQDLLYNYFCHQGERRVINETIKALLDNEVPSQCRYIERSGFQDSRDYILEDAEVDKAWRTIAVRYVAAREAAEEKRRQEILATPIDDAAWEEELQRRADIDQPWSSTILVGPLPAHQRK